MYITPWGSRIKRTGVLVGNFEKNPQLRDCKILFSSSVFSLFSLLGGTRENETKLKEYLVSCEGTT